ncbi:hypothetical protein A3F66_04040 [candidate division TM6 bacterium RIFCSPHIGHO2_12_FULL_32_22]|nr:MAG: hypothetical protein A3F66_04040 [candidate division TM6 bacterium RIFCSPHIGHO2_12_FULL_32_22]
MKKILFLNIALLTSLAIADDMPKAPKKVEAKKSAATPEKMHHEAKPEAKKAETKKAAPTKSKKSDTALINEILNKTLFTPEFKTTMKEALKPIAQQIPGADADKIYTAFMKHYDESKSKFVDLYKQKLNAEELEILVNFLNDPVIKKFLGLQPELGNLNMQTSQEALMKAIQEVQQSAKPEDKKEEAHKAPKADMKKAEAKPEAKKADMKKPKAENKK